MSVIQKEMKLRSIREEQYAEPTSVERLTNMPSKPGKAQMPSQTTLSEEMDGSRGGEAQQPTLFLGRHINTGK